MEKIRWSDAFSVGVDELDNQHKKIIEIVNRLIDDISLGVSAELIADTLTEMVAVVVGHFKREEYLLEQAGYPDLDAEKDAHKSYHSTTTELYKDLMSSNNVALEDMVQYIRNWWMDHILNEDRKYKSCLAGEENSISSKKKIKTRISSRITFFYKFILSAIIFFVLVLLGFYFFFGQGYEKFLYLAGMSIMGFFVLPLCVSLKHVEIDKNNIIVSNYIKVNIRPFNEIESIYQRFNNAFSPVTIKFKDGKSIVFMPTSKFLLFAFDHSIVYELKRMAGLN